MISAGLALDASCPLALDCSFIAAVSNSFPQPPADWLALIIGSLLQCLGRCVGPNPRGLSGLPNPRLPDQLLMRIRERLHRLSARFAQRLARHAAGLTAPRPNASQTASPKSVPDPIIADSAELAAANPRPKTGAALLPRHYAWLLRLIQETAVSRSQFRNFLDDPDIAALLAADPRLRSILRPLCHALGIPKSQALSLYPKPPPPDAPPPAPAISGDTPKQAAQAASPPRATPPPDALINAQTSSIATPLFSQSLA